MNRENKLAIIIGFSLVLVVAVLISDHFSRARTAKIGTDITAGTPEDYGAATAGLTRPIGASEQIPVSDRPLAGNLEPKASSLHSTDPGADDARAENDTEGPAAKPDSTASSKPYSHGTMKSYEIKDGDKLFRIASTYYGDGNLWHKLVDFNKAKLPKPEALKVGMKLDIPPKDVLLGEAVMPPAGYTADATKTKVIGIPERSEWPAGYKDPATGKPTAPSVPPKMVPVESRTARTPDATKPTNKKVSLDTYKVEHGDDLSKIAQKLLGSSRRATELYELNKDTLEDEHTLAVGATLKVPAR